jgi:lipid II:glycine glycyltransferase (peptidoglycan interpeptide bridge formation enzyme)
LELFPGYFDQAAWTELISELRPLTLTQTWEYAEAKAATGGWDVERCAIMEDDRVVGAAQAVLRRLPFSAGGLVFANRAPLWSPALVPNSAGLSSMFDLLHGYWARRPGTVLRIAPPLRTDEAPKPFPVPRFSTGSAGWSSMEVDLALSVEELRREMKQKWRNCLYKAERSDAEVTIGTDEDLFGRFLGAYSTHLKEQRLTKSTTPELLRELQTLLPAERKLVVLEVVLGDEPVGWALIATYGEVAEYIASVTTPKGRSINAGQLLLWQAVYDARARGLKRFDLGGVDPAVKESGIAHFKAGLGGRHYRYVPEIEAHTGGLTARLIRWRIERTRRAAATRSAALNRAGAAAPLAHMLVSGVG